jgi:SAM-dependent methyltransferase
VIVESDIVVPPEVMESARRTIGTFFQPISRADPEANIRDFLDASKSFKRAEILKRYVPLDSKKVLEVGSGYGTNLAVWIRRYRIDGYGIEPGSTGFNDGFHASKRLLAANGIDPDRVVDATGESIPFPDETFGIVYSANVLEHTENPERVLAESLRVLRRGGVCHMEMPNFLSYFEGHYMVLQPPIVWRPILPWWVQRVYRRDPSFAKTLRTHINPLWCRRTVRTLSKAWPLELISLGEDLFLERISKPFRFETQIVSGKLHKSVACLQAINHFNWIGRSIVGLKGYYPIYLTMRKL